MNNTRSRGYVIQRYPSKNIKSPPAFIFTEDDFPPLQPNNYRFSQRCEKGLTCSHKDNDILLSLSSDDDSDKIFSFDDDDSDDDILSDDEKDVFDISLFNSEPSAEELKLDQSFRKWSENCETFRNCLEEIDNLSRQSLAKSPQVLETVAKFIETFRSYIAKLRYPNVSYHQFYDMNDNLTKLSYNIQKILPLLDHAIIKCDNYDTAAIIINGRSHEDRCVISTIGDIKYYAVFDGHGKKFYLPDSVLESHVVSFIENNLHVWLDKNLNSTTINLDDENAVSYAIIETFIEMDKFLYDNNYKFGSTANIVLIINFKIYQVNLGDSRSILFSGKDIVNETIDCKPKNEKERIESAGGWISGGLCYRVNDIYATSRSFGDFCCKMVDGSYSPNGPMSAIPIIKITQRSPGQYILMGSDGLFDGLKESSKLVELINAELDNKISLKDACIKCLQQTSAYTNDDITIILSRV
ncbi:Protein phosphatase 2C [uncultured virus]|nr:Protein phosphatase 2C [uncultured virus]